MAFAAKVCRVAYRESERVALNLGTTVRLVPSAPVDATIADISETGVRIVIDLALQIEDEISVGLPGIGTFRARVDRQCGTEYGCSFRVPITKAVIAEVTVARSDAALTPIASKVDPRTRNEDAPAARLPILTRVGVIVGLNLAMWGGIFACAKAALT